MEARLIFLGANMLLASAALGIAGWLAGMDQLVGVAAAMSVASASILAVGVGYSEPSLQLLLDFQDTARSTVMKLAEDIGLANHMLQAVPRPGGALIVLADPSNPPRNPKPLVGFDGAPYIAFKPRISVEAGGMSVEEALRNSLVEKYMVSRSILVEEDGETYRIMLEDLSPAARRMAAKPLSPIAIAVLTIMAENTGRRVALESQRLEGGVLELRVRRAEES